MRKLKLFGLVAMLVCGLVFTACDNGSSGGDGSDIVLPDAPETIGSLDI